MNRDECKVELADLKERQKNGSNPELDARVAELEAIYQTFKAFNKKKFIQNYKALLAKTSIRVNQIETEADVAQGYMSRIDKEGSTSDPSIEYVCTCAKMFGVSLDELLYGTVEEMTETETFIADFVDSLIADTMKDVINWNEVPNYEGQVIPDEEINTFGHPMYYFNSPEPVPPYSNPVIAYYSRYDERTRLSMKFPSFTAVLPNTHDQIYIMVCELEGTSFSEMYLRTGDDVNPICNTVDICETVRGKFRKLYEEIRKSGKRVHISVSAVNSISNYMKRRK